MRLVLVQYTLICPIIRGLRGVTGRYAPRGAVCTCTRGVPARYAGPLRSGSPLGSMYIGPHETGMGLVYTVYLKDRRFTGRYGPLRPTRCGLYLYSRGTCIYAGPFRSGSPLGSMCIGPHETGMGLISTVYLKDRRFTGCHGALRPLRCMSCLYSRGTCRSCRAVTLR